MSSPPDGVCDVNKGVDAAVVHGFPPENSSLYKQAMQCHKKRLMKLVDMQSGLQSAIQSKYSWKFFQ